MSKEIKRYCIYVTMADQYIPDMVEAEDGEYVKHEDYLKLEKKNVFLKKFIGLFVSITVIVISILLVI